MRRVRVSLIKNISPALYARGENSTDSRKCSWYVSSDMDRSSERGRFLMRTRENALDSFIPFIARKTMSAHKDTRDNFFLGTCEQEVAKMSDAVDTVCDGMTISSLTWKDEDDNPDCDARKVHFVEVPFVPADITPNALHTEARRRMQLLYLFAWVRPRVLPLEITENRTCRQ